MNAYHIASTELALRSVKGGFVWLFSTKLFAILLWDHSFFFPKVPSYVLVAGRSQAFRNTPSLRPRMVRYPQKNYIIDTFIYLRILNVDICPTGRQLFRCNALLWA